MAQKHSATRVLLGIGIALVAATAGFSATSLFSQLQPKSSSKPLFEKRPIEPLGGKTTIDSLNQESGNNTRQNSQTFSPSDTPVSNSRRRRRNSLESQTESAKTTTTSTDLSPQTSPGDSQRSNPEQPTLKNSPSPSLVEKLREIRSSRKITPQPSSETISPPTSIQNSPPVEKHSQPVVIPAVPPQSLKIQILL